MKKIVIAILLSALALGLVACGVKKDPVVEEAEYGIELEDKAKNVVDDYNQQFQNADDTFSTEE